MTGKMSILARSAVLLPILVLALACGGPKITYVPKVGAASYPPVSASKVTFFETTPQKGSYIELGELTVEDELKCNTGGAFEEEKALRTMEDLRKKNPDMAEISDITMLELLAERGQIDRNEICDLIPRFTRKEEKTNFIVLALQGSNLRLIAQKAGDMGANAVMKIQHGEWKMRGKPSDFGADGTQAPPLKIGVKTSVVAINYEAPKGEAVSAEEKVLVVIKDKGTGEAEETTETAAGEGTKPAVEEKAPPKETGKPEETKPAKAKEVAAEKKIEKVEKVEKKEIKAAAKEEKKPGPSEKFESEKYFEKAGEKEKEIKALEEAMAAKKAEQKDLNQNVLKDKEQMKILKKELLQTKLKAAKLKAEEDAKKKSEAIKAKMEEKKLAKLKEAESKKTLAAMEADAKAKAAKEKETETKAKEAESKAKADEAAKAKADEAAKAKADEAAKAKADEAAKAKEKEKEKEKAKAAEKEKAKEGGEAKKPPEEEKKPEEGADATQAVIGAKEKIKASKAAIFECLRSNKAEGSIQVTYLFKPSGEIDALGFDPGVPDAAHKCIMELLKKDKFPQCSKYYKAIFKYTMK